MSHKEISPPPMPLRSGATGRHVRRLQEWLGFHRHGTAIDGEFGPATLRALDGFRTGAGLPTGGPLVVADWEALTRPMARAIAPLPPDGRLLPELVVAYAEQHLREHPVEVGGDNRGPWVRLYTDGNDGPAWRWCAAFATFVIRQASATLGVPMPIKRSLSCDLVASDAIARGTLGTGAAAAKAGGAFLLRRVAHDWVHMGLVIEVGADYFVSIEGNTNDEGSANGYEVCRRVRAFGPNIDFVAIA